MNDADKRDDQENSTLNPDLENSEASSIIRDPLTGAYSRALMQEWLEREAERARRYKGSFCLCLIDLDYFKSINDGYGHQRGDQVLIEVVQRILRIIRGSDILFRYGGDEFLLLLPNTVKIQAVSLAESLLDAVRCTPIEGDPPVRLSLSIGVAAFPTDGPKLKTIIDLADKRTYLAKRAGRSRVVSDDLVDTSVASDIPIIRLLERDKAMEGFQLFLENLSQKKRGLFKVIGESGSGRSRFLTEASGLARLRGYEVVQIVGKRGLKFQAYGAIQTVESYELPYSGGVAALEGYFETFLKKNARTGLMIFVDNFQYLDKPTINLLWQFLSTSGLSVVSMIVVMSKNDDQTSPWQNPFYIESVDLPPLSPESMAIWIRSVFGWESNTEFIQWLYAQTGGLPGLIQKGIQYLIQHGFLHSTTEQGWTLAEHYQSIQLSEQLGLLKAAHPNNLPSLSTDFMGREKEVGHITDLLKNKRLVTLLGAGGIGKTRLALEVASNLLPEYPNGVYFVSLAAITDPELVASSIAHGIGMKVGGSEPLQKQLVTYLADKRLLLVLDNFEQIVAAAPTIGEILSSAPAVRILVTSREVLHISGEHGFSVPPLVLPKLHPLPPFKEILECESVVLFTERAQALTPNFVLTPENAPSIVQICHKLDGLPLAIELAAAQIRVLTPKDILTRLNNSLKLLTEGPRDLPARQQTLRNAIAWSYNLLDPEYKLLFRMLGVFMGGCTLEAAEYVCSSEQFPELNILRGLTALLDKSLIRREEGASRRPRYVMLETIREYALEQLLQEGQRDELRDKHQQYFISWVEDVEEESSGEKQAQWLNKMDEEHDNLRAAMQWAMEHKDGETVLRIAGAIWKFWHIHSHFVEGLRWIQNALPRAPYSRYRAKAMWGAGWMTTVVEGDMEKARQFFKAGETLSRELGEHLFLGYALHGIGAVARAKGDFETARFVFSESLPIFQSLGNLEHVAWTHHHLGVLALEQGNLSESVSQLQDCAASFIKLGERWPLAETYAFIGLAKLRQDEYEASWDNYKLSMGIFEELGDKASSMQVQSSMGAVLFEQGKVDEALQTYKKSVRNSYTFGDKLGTLWGIEKLADAAKKLGKIDVSARLYCALQTLGFVQPLGTGNKFLQQLSFVEKAVGEEKFKTIADETKTITVEEALNFAVDNVEQGE